MEKIKEIGIGTAVATGAGAVLAGIPGMIVCGGVGVGALLLTIINSAKN